MTGEKGEVTMEAEDVGGREPERSAAEAFEDAHAQQIFVYGAAGVKQLTQAHVLVLGSGAVGAEVGASNGNAN